MNTYHTIVAVRLEDDYGIPQSTVPVEVMYGIEIDQSYGSDADGRRGVRREEIFIISAAVYSTHAMYMTLEDLERAKAQAEAQLCAQLMLEGGVNASRHSA